MQLPRKRLWRTASQIYQRLVSEDSATQLKLPFEDWWHCDRLIRKRQRAQHRDWDLAASKLERDLKTGLAQLIQQLTALHAELMSDSSQQQISSVRELYAELLALEEEFGELKLDLRAQTISVVTEPIELEAVYLGPFEICLKYGNLKMDVSSPYRVIATDPNPAFVNDCVTHPHVQSEVVCEGDGRLAIRRSLEQGRLFDFFTMVVSLLRTYNPGSPYVELSDWHSVECTECADVIAANEQTRCENCEIALCTECARDCSDCDCPFCHECLSHCDSCHSNCCSSCLKQCMQCNADCCQRCLLENERCSDCDAEELEETEKELPETHASAANPVTATTVQPDCLGETVVPA
ncbi:hypothetical protein [Gimesia algae]|uniref:Uncharacterized protein n=1 Tax=Gimesia algae TaxID=2527971 RepID=A0A517VEZ1_9PLAN|nr:hypothetical protein [Gimesia algae]QDT91578.1 hypothetical protein Pan161_32380 [Gimesia algae]